ncbi:MAG: hypothetical protein Q8Q10_02475 [bacterium]|nr:hypothetical protein [bacterium]
MRISTAFAWLVIILVSVLFAWLTWFPGYQFFSISPSSILMFPKKLVGSNNFIRWKLVSGDTNQACPKLFYSGRAEARGWYEYAESSLGKEWLFHYVPGSRSKFFPIDVDVNVGKGLTSGMDEQYVKIENVSSDLAEKLKRATPSAPASITIVKFVVSCEGYPSVWVE